jgi:Type II secretion system (T2SS), protein G
VPQAKSLFWAIAHDRARASVWGQVGTPTCSASRRQYDVHWGIPLLTEPDGWSGTAHTMVALGLNPEIVRRLLICTAVGFAMAVTAYLCAWHNNREWIGYRWDHQRTFRWLRELKTALDEYHKEKGTYPENLADLKITSGKKSGDVLDPWENPFQYRAEGNSYRLFSLGRDRKRGGEGLDEDVDVRDLESKNVDVDREPRVAIPTLWQFTFECPTFGPRITCALAGICAFVACLVTTMPGRPGMMRPLIALSLTLVASLVTALAICMLEVPTHH